MPVHGEATGDCAFTTATLHGGHGDDRTHLSHLLGKTADPIRPRARYLIRGKSAIRYRLGYRLAALSSRPSDPLGAAFIAGSLAYLSIPPAWHQEERTTCLRLRPRTASKSSTKTGD